MNARVPQQLPGFDAVDAALIDHLHEGFPLCDRPFAAVGEALGLAEDEVIERLRKLLANGVLTRLGPLYQIERAGGIYILAALEVPAERFAEVAALVNAHLQVAHNYRREHRLNMWFVVAAESEKAATRCMQEIAAETGLPVHAFPKEREYRVELRLPAAAPPLPEDLR
jgi:siroheme decarboxylase